MKDILLDQQEIDNKPLVIFGANHFAPAGVVAGYLFLIAGVFAFVQNFIFSVSLPILLISIFATLLGLIFITTKEGFILNSEKGCYKKCTFFLGRAYGTWVILPPIDSVNVSPANYSHVVQNSLSRVVTSKEDKYKVVLFVKDSGRGIIVSLFNNKQAVEVANKIGNVLRVPIFLIDGKE